MRSNGYNRLMADLRRHRQAFDFTKDNLGSDLLDIAEDSHRRCLDEERSPDNTPWMPLNPRYERWKSTYFPGKPMGELYGIMKAPAEIEGERDIGPRKAWYIFGKTDEARAEAAHFEEGDPANNRPGRPFTGLDDIAVQQSDDRLGRHHLEMLSG